MNYDIINTSINYSVPTYEIKIPVGTQTLKMQIFADSITFKTIHWYVSMCLYSKRKQIDNNFDFIKTTGKNTGLSALVNAKNSLVWFESYIKEHYCDYNNVMVVQWLDNRRKKIYTHNLKDIGYAKGMYQHKEALLKKI